MHGVGAGREGGEERGVARIGREAKGTDLREGGGERGAAAPVVVARPLSLAREQRELRIGDGIGDTEAAKGGTDRADEHGARRGAADHEAGGDAGAEMFQHGDVNEARGGGSKRGGGRGIVEFGDDRTDEGVRVLGLLGGGGDAGADGPDGFVGDDGFTEILFGNALKAAGDLGAEDAFKVAGLALGAVGVWIGTAFLLAEESNLFPVHQEEIIRGSSEDFIITRAYTGKTARDYKNEVIKAWDESGLKALPMPLQGVLMDDFIAAADAANRAELINNPAGQISGMLKGKRPAKDILMSMVVEAEQVIERLGSMRSR